MKIVMEQIVFVCFFAVSQKNISILTASRLQIKIINQISQKLRRLVEK
jgi:hypothetical protein